MSGLSVELLSSIVAQLAGQRPQESCVAADLSNSSKAPANGNEDEVLVGNEKFTTEELLLRRKKKEKCTQAQQTFAVCNINNGISFTFN